MSYVYTVSSQHVTDSKKTSAICLRNFINSLSRSCIIDVITDNGQGKDKDVPTRVTKAYGRAKV